MLNMGKFVLSSVDLFHPCSFSFIRRSLKERKQQLMQKRMTLLEVPLKKEKKGPHRIEVGILLYCLYCMSVNE